MGTFKEIFMFVWWVIEILFNFVVFTLCHISSFCRNQFKEKSTEMTKDEADAHTTINPKAMELFYGFTGWWDPNGRLKALHKLNVIRVPFIRDGLAKDSMDSSDKPLKGLKILDAGCGGGLLSEPLAKLGATVIGIDPAENPIKTASANKILDPELQTNELTYIATTVEEHIKHNSKYYDAVIASEVIDHIDNPELFVRSCVKALKPGGRLFFTAPNRTWVSKFGFIFFAENIYKNVPKGTFRYEKFVTPEELTTMLEKNSCKVEKFQGHLFNFINCSWFLVKLPHCFYGLQAVKMN